MFKYIKYGFLFILLLVLSGCNLNPQSNTVEINENVYELTELIDKMKEEGIHSSLGESLLWLYVENYIEAKDITEDGYIEYYSITDEDKKELSDNEIAFLKENYVYQKALTEVFTSLIKLSDEEFEQLVKDADDVNYIITQGIFTEDVSELSDEETSNLIKKFEEEVVAKSNEIKKLYEDGQLIDVDMDVTGGNMEVMALTPKEMNSGTHLHAKDLKVGEHLVTDDVFVDIVYKVAEIKIDEEVVRENVLVDYIEETYPNPLELIYDLEIKDKNFKLGFNVKKYIEDEQAKKDKEIKEKAESLFEIDEEQLEEMIDKIEQEDKE